MSDAPGTKIKVTSRAEAQTLLSEAEDKALARCVEVIERAIKENYRGNSINVAIDVSDRVEKALVKLYYAAGWTVSVGSYEGAHSGSHYIVLA
jgi:hypothetical protein